MWRRRGTPQDLFGIYWWTWKTTIYHKNCWSGSRKNVRISIFTLSYFFRKKIKNIWRYHYFTPVYQKSWWYDLQVLEICDRLKLLIMGHSLPFYFPLKNQKNKILKKWKKLLEISSFYTSVPKPQSYELQSFWAICCPFTLLTTQKIKILKKWKKPWGYHHFKKHDHMLYCSWDMVRNRCN